MEIYVGNLPYSMDDQGVNELFAAHGTVDKAKVIVDYDTGRSKGFAFVTMSNDSEAQSAIDALNGADVGGRPLKVNQARERTQGGGGGGGGGFRGGGGGGGGGGFRGPKGGGGGHRGGGGGFRDRGGYDRGGRGGRGDREEHY